MKELQGKGDWDKRQEIALEVLGATQGNVFTNFVEGVSQGLKTQFLLDRHSLKWPEFASLYRKDERLFNVYSVAKVLGEEYRQVLREEEADRRAVEGVEKPVFYKGDVCGHVNEYSDSLLALQLKAGNPDKYADRVQQEIKGAILSLSVEGVVRGTED